MNCQFAFALIVSGLSIGLMYSLIALGFVLVYKATDAINFAQGEFVMLAGFIAARRWRARGHAVLAAIVAAVAAWSLFSFAPRARGAAAAARPPGRRGHHGDDRAGAPFCAACRRSRSAAETQATLAADRRRADRAIGPAIAAADAGARRLVIAAVSRRLHLVLPEEPHGRRDARRRRQPAGGDGDGHQRASAISRSPGRWPASSRRSAASSGAACSASTRSWRWSGSRCFRW